MPPHKIIATFVYPPIPIRTMDWQAHYDNDEPDDEGRMVTGHGRTEEEAVLDLIVEHPRPDVWCCENFPTQQYVIDVCKIGQQANCCRYLTMSPKGWSCEKKSDLRLILDARAASGSMHARADNCEGRSSR